MIKKLIPFSYLIIWIALSLYSLFTIMFSNQTLVDSSEKMVTISQVFNEKHFFNLIALAVSIIVLLFNNKLGHLIGFFALMACFFSKSTFLVKFHFFNIFGLTFSWIYFPLIVLFVFINYEILGYWVEKAAKTETE